MIKLLGSCGEQLWIFFFRKARLKKQVIASRKKLQIEINVSFQERKAEQTVKP